MRAPIVIDQAAAGFCRSLSWSLSWPRHYGGLSMLVIMAVLFGRPDLAFAQYPSFSSEAEPASVSADADDAPSGGSGNDASANSGESSGASSMLGRGQVVAPAAISQATTIIRNQRQTSLVWWQIGSKHGKAATIILCESFVLNLPRWNLSSAEPAWRFRAMMCRVILMNCAPSLPRCEDQQARQCKA